MAFEATKNFKKKSAGGRFEATEKFSRNEELLRKRYESKASYIVSSLNSRIKKLYDDYSATAKEKEKFVSGEASTYDNPMKYKPKFTSKSYVDEANSIKSYIEENKDYLSGEQYLAALQNVNIFLDTDFTESDKTWNEYYNAVQKSGGKENFAKAMEKYQADQTALKKAGLNKNSTYAQIEGVVNDTSMDAGAGPLEQAQGRAYKDRRLSSEEKDYLRSLLKTEEKVSTMTTDEVISMVEKVSENNSEESVKSNAEKIYGELTSNSDDWEKLEYINNLRLKDPTEITDDERAKETEYSVYLRDKYGIYDYSQNLKEQIEQKVRNDNKSAETAYYYTENGETKSMTWGNYLNERTAGEAYKSVTDENSDNYNPEAAEIYNRLSQLDDFYIKTEGMNNPESADSLYEERENLNKRFEELTGTTFDAVEYYESLQKSKARSETFTNTIDSVMEKLDNLPKWISMPLNIASGNAGGIASDIVGLIDENAGDVVKAVTGTIGLRPSVEGAAMVMSIPGAVLSGFDYVGNMVGNIGHNDTTDYKNYRQLNIYNDYSTLWAQQIPGKGQEMFRQDLLDLGLSEKTANNIARIGYGGLSSGLNSIAVIATSCALFGEEAGAIIGTIILSGQAASSTTHEAINNGSTAGEALMSGFAAGVAEYIGEKVSLGYFFDNILHGTMSAATVKEFFKSAGKWALGSVIEGSEEVFTSAMNRFADYIINSDHSNMELAVQNYISQGYSAEEAKNKAANDWWTETFYDFWGGFVGGSLMGGAALAGNVAVNTKNKIQDTARQADIGKAITGTDAGKNVLELAEKRGLDTSKAAKEVSEGRGIGKLVSKVRNAVRNRNMGKLAQDVVETELKAAKETAMPIVEDENLADMVAEIATGTADVSAISVLASSGVLTDENADKVLEALEAVQKRTENAEVRNMINDIVETAESTEGKAYNANNIYGIKRDGGTTKYILEDGTEVDSGEFGLTSKDKTLFVNAVKNMTDAEANEMISAYRKYADGTDEGVFATTWGLYRSLGETGAAKNSERMAGYKSRIYFTDDAEVNNVLVASAIEQGVKARARNEKKVNIKARAERVIKERGRAKGEVRGEEHLGKNKSGAKTVSRTLAKLGYDVEFLSEDSKLRGKRIGDTKINGAYDAETNTIYLRADAEYNASDVRGILGHTLAHEITHSIKVWSESDYNVLTDYIRDALGADFDTLVRQKMNALGTDYGKATDEVIADGCEMLLRDSKALEKLAAENANLFVKIASKIKEFISKLRKAQADMYGENEELHDSALRLREALKSLEEVQEVFDNALENSIRNMRNALAEAENAKAKANLDVLEKAAEKEGVQLSEEEQNDGNTEKISEETNGKIEFDAKTDSVSPAFSEETWRESDYVQHRNEAAKTLSAALGVSKAKALKYIDDVNSIAKTIADDRVRLDYRASSFGSAFVSNAEYGGSFDYTTLCKKRRIYTGTFSEIQKRLRNTALTADEILDLRNMLIAAGYEATCGLCYVEGSRAQMGKFAKEFINLYKRDNPGAWIPDMADVNTPDGVEQMRINHPEAYESYEYFWNHYGKLKDSDKALFASQQKPKLYESRKAYRNEIKKLFKSDSSIERKNLNGGIRMQSFSDFEIVHLIDTMQVIMDMSVVGLAGQAYTKVPEFARAFGNTGLKINLSLIAKGVDENGRLIFDDREGMPHDTAFELRDQYSENVGTVLVTFTDEQAFAAMADDRIDFIIPFHRSQWKKGQYNAMGLPKGTKDYTYVQNEKLIKKTYHEYRGRQVLDKATNYMPNEYWDFSKSGKENAEAYLDMCAKNNKRPKFYKFLDYDGNGRYSLKADGSTDGYWKLLIDFKMYDNDGNGSPQRAVRPDFNMEESRKMLDEYKGGHQSYPVAYDVVDKFVDKYKSEHEGMQFSEETSDEFAEKEKAAIEKALANMSDAEYNRIGWARTLFTREDVDKLSKVNGEKLKDGTVALKVNNKIVFSDGKAEAPTYYAVLVFDANTAEQVKTSSFYYFKGEGFSSLSQNDIRNLIERGKRYGTYGFYRSSYKRVGKEYSVQAGLPTGSKGFTDSAFLVVRGGVYSEDKGRVSRDIQGRGRVSNTVAAKSETASMTKARIDSLIEDSGAGNRTDYAQAWITSINPTDFLNMTLSEKGQNREYFDKMPGDYGSTVDEYDYIEGLKKETRQTPYLAINYETGEVVGHEGRHRMRALEKSGIKSAAVKIEFRDSDGRIIKTLNGQGNPLATIESLQIFNQRGTGQSAEIFNVIPLNKSHRDEIYSSYGNNDTALQYSEETETSRDTLVSDMEAVAETDEEKSFVEKLKAEVEKANALQEELDEVNRKIKEASFTKGADRSVLPSLNEEKSRLVKQLNRLDSKFYGYRGYDTFKTLAERKSKDAVIAERLRGKEALRSQQQKYEEAAQSIKDTLAQREENRRRREIVRDIAKRIDKLDKLAKEDSKTKHIPSALRDIVKTFREQIDSRTQNYDERIARAENAIADLERRRGKYLDAYTEYTQLAERIKQYDRGSKDFAEADSRMGQLKQDFDRYNSLTKQIEKKLSSIEKSGERSTRAADYLSEMLSYYKTYDNADSTYYIDVSDLTQAIEDLQHSIGERPLYMLSADQLEDVLNVTKAVQKKISDANKLFKSGLSVSKTTAKVAGEAKDARNKKVSRFDLVRNTKNRTADRLFWNNLKPYELFKQSGSDTLYRLYRNLQKAEGDSGRLVAKYAKKYKETAQKYGIKEKMFSEKSDITFDNGKTARLTGGEILTLYLTSKRGQGRTHLLGDGFRLSGGIMRLVADGKERVNENADMMTLTENDLTKFGKTLSDDMRRFGDEMQKYMSTEIAADGNAVSMKLYDIMLFGEDNYITLTVDNNYLRSTIDPKNDTAKLKNSKFTIKTVANATQALSISSFVNVYQTHASDMAAYAAFTLPLEDIAKVINGTAQTEKGSTRVRDVLGSKLYGEMTEFLKDVNGGIRSEDNLTSTRLFGAVKAARVGLNLRVIIQQPTAVVRAMAEIDPKYFFGTNRKYADGEQMRLLDEMTKYTSTWIVKELGGVDINTKQSIGRTITDLGAKGNTFGHTASKVLQEGQFWLAEKADQVTWMWLWQACKNEAIARFKKNGTEYTYEDVLKAAGDRFDEITNKTQVYDSVFSRSKIMRSGKMYEKFLTMFMAEPMTTANMAIDAARLIGDGQKQKGARIIASLVCTGLITAAASALIDAVRDDDDDENFGEKYLEALVQNLIENINPVMWIPLFRDIYNLALHGFSVERPDVEIVGDYAGKVQKLVKVLNDKDRNGEDVFNSVWDVASITADMCGVALSSFSRDVKGLYNTFVKNSKATFGKTSATNINTAFDNAWKNGLSRRIFEPRSDADKLYYAIIHEDDIYVSRIESKLGDKKYRARVISGLTDNDARIAEAAAAHIDGDYEAYAKIIRDIAKDGFETEHVQAAVLKAENIMLKKEAADEDYDRVTSIDGLIATEKDIISDVENGDFKLLEEYYNTKVKYYTEKGKDDPEKDALTATKNFLSNYYREAYKEGDKKEKSRIYDILTDVEVDGYRLYKSSTIRGWDE